MTRKNAQIAFGLVGMLATLFAAMPAEARGHGGGASRAAVHHGNNRGPLKQTTPAKVPPPPSHISHLPRFPHFPHFPHHHHHGVRTIYVGGGTGYTYVGAPAPQAPACQQWSWVTTQQGARVLACLDQQQAPQRTTPEPESQDQVQASE